MRLRTIGHTAAVAAGLTLAGVPLAAAASAATTYDLYTVANGYTSAQTGPYTFFQAPNASEATPSSYTAATAPYTDGPLHGFRGSDASFPLFGANSSSSDYVSSTDTIPGSTVFEHPGPSTAGITEFTPPGGAANVSATATLRRDDTTTNGNGVNGALFAVDGAGNVVGGTTALTALPATTPGGTITLTLPSTTVPSGGHVILVLDNNGEYAYDGTGVVMDVTVDGGPGAVVPEVPYAIALPLGGAAVAALVLRRRRNRG